MRTTQTQNRRLISTSSGSTSASAETVNRLQCHAADRARTRSIADDFRMHRAGIGGSQRATHRRQSALDPRPAANHCSSSPSRR